MFAKDTNFFGGAVLSSNDAPPKTKRYLYHILEDKLSASKAIDKGETRCSYTILGPRKVGKTIILRQLCDHFATASRYYDISTLKSPVNFNDLFARARGDGVHIILLDEISKICTDDIPEFVSAVKNYCWCISFVLTGSTKAAVKQLSDMVGRAESEYELPPILYIERLAWQANANVSDFAQYRSKVSFESFKNYIHYGTVTDDTDGWIYTSAVVDDTMQSILKRDYLSSEYPTIKELDRVTMTSILQYIAVCQLVYATEKKQYCTIPSLQQVVEEKLHEVYRNISRAVSLPKQCIADMCHMMLDSGLAKPMYQTYWDLEMANDGYRVKTVDSSVPSIVFEYPWYANFVLEDILSAGDMWGYWVENLLYLRMLYVYGVVDKYRLGTDVLDIVYSEKLSSRYGLECKFTALKNIRHGHLQRYKMLGSRLQLRRVDITSTDECLKQSDTSCVYKIHELIAALELEYISHSDMPYTSPNVYELIKRYGFLPDC